MEILRLQAGMSEPIGPRPYSVSLISSIDVAEGAGEAHAYVLYFEPGGEIGPHEAGYGQLFYAASGNGWVAGADGRRHPLAEGEAALITRGEVHSKGSESGMTAFMVQVRDLRAVAGHEP
jgi:quercetin dioxygenase-like cupin family protein